MRYSKHSPIYYRWHIFFDLVTFCHSHFHTAQMFWCVLKMDHFVYSSEILNKRRWSMEKEKKKHIFADDYLTMKWVPCQAIKSKKKKKKTCEACIHNRYAHGPFFISSHQFELFGDARARGHHSIQRRTQFVTCDVDACDKWVKC